MVDFFPDSYSDELLYSMIARYHIRSGNIFFRTTTKELFGQPDFCAIVDMPSHINNLTHNLPPHNSLSNKELIINHTLFPYYTAFLPEDRVKSIYRSMQKSNQGNIYIKTGIIPSTIHISTSFNFCPECCKEDLDHLGEYYWHRIHNTPGALVCPKHKTILHKSKIKLHPNYKSGFIAAEPENCINISNNQLSSDKNKLVNFAIDIQWLYNNYFVIRKSQDIENGFRLKYLHLLADKGLTNRKFKRHFLNDFINDFHHYYGSDFLNQFHSDFSIDNPHSWLIKILRKHDKSFHPIRHLLIIQYLSGSLSQFLNIKNLDLSGMVPEERVYRNTNYEASAFSDQNIYKTNSHRYINIIDWNLRDRQTLAKAKMVVKIMLASKEKPEKITVKSIGIKIGTYNWFVKNHEKLPLTMNFLQRTTETTEDFQIRRINYAAAEIHSRGYLLTKWKLMKLAGLEKNYSGKVDRLIKETIIKYSYPQSILKS